MTQTLIPFFIIGAPRSGTSLLSRMLNHHDDIAVPFETDIIKNFHGILSAYEPLSNTCNQRRLVEDILDLPTMQDVTPAINIDNVMAEIHGTHFQDVFEGILNSWTHLQGKHLWGEKSVTNVLFSDTLLDLFPRAKYIHIIRDGRDVSMSLQRAPFGPKTTFTAALRWRQLVELSFSIRDRVPDDQYLALRYEDLLDQPKQQLQRVCDFLGEPYRKSMLRFSENNTPCPSDPVNDANLQKALMPNNKYKWKRLLLKPEVELIESAVGPTLKKCGYSLSTKQRPLSDPEIFYRKFVEPLPAKTIAMLRNKQGHEKALAKLKLLLKWQWARLTHSS